MGDPSNWCVCLLKPLFFFGTLADFGRPLNTFFFFFPVTERPDLESQFKDRVQEAIRYARTIDDFDELIDQRTLARHCLGPKPSLYVLQTIDRGQRKHELCLQSSILFFFFFFV